MSSSMLVTEALDDIGDEAPNIVFRKYTNGVTVSSNQGSVAINMVEKTVALFEMDAKRAVLVPSLSRPLGVVLAIAYSHEAANAWVKEVENQAQKSYPNDPVMAWWCGPYVGFSSATVLAWMAPDCAAASKARAWLTRSGAGYRTPQDEDDWDRCDRIARILGMKAYSGMLGVPKWTHEHCSRKVKY